MLMHTRFISKILFSFTLLLTNIPFVWALNITPTPPQLNAKAYLLMDYNSGQILVAQNEHQRMEPASLTKMLTSYVLSYELERGNVSETDMVTVSENAWAKNFPGSSVMFIEVGKLVELDDLHKGIVIQSGNDASIAVAEHVAGSENSFADLMNYHAKRLGMTGSHFVNSTGLPHDNHYTTAYDMALIGQALIRDFPAHYELYSHKEFTYNNIPQANRNPLLWDQSMQVDGIKTGHTESAGYCLVTSAVEDNMRLIAVVMGADSKQARKVDSKRLLTYGFRYFDTIKPYKSGEKLKNTRVWMAEKETIDLGILEEKHLTIPKGAQSRIEANIELNERLMAPISKGDEVGTVYISLDGKDVTQYKLVALENVNEGSWWSQFIDWVILQFQKLFG